MKRHNQVSQFGGEKKTGTKRTTTENFEEEKILVCNKTEMKFYDIKKNKSPDCQKDVGVHVEKPKEGKYPSGECWMPH